MSDAPVHPVHPVPRVPERHEFVPADYFRELTKGDLFPDPSRALEIDVGCGDGTFLVDLAEQVPGHDFLGVERLLGRVRKVSRKAERRGLANVRVLRLDSAYTVRWLLPTAGVHRLHLLFPDPWPKKKHRKRRLVSDEFVAGVDRILEPEGEWLFKSDHDDYFEEAVAVIRASGRFEPVEWPDGAFPYPQTDFERQWRAEGRAIRHARFRRRRSAEG